MVPNEVKVNGVKMNELEADGTSQPFHINVHIHQESALPEFLKAGKSVLKFFVNPAVTLGLSARKSRLQLATWTAQMILGAMSGALGVFFCMGPFFELKYSGAAFWTGAVAISAGAVAIIQEKRRGIWWRSWGATKIGIKELSQGWGTCSLEATCGFLGPQSFLKILFFLATISTSIAAIVICTQELQNSLYYYKSLCDEDKAWPTRAYSPSDPQEDERKNQCLDYLNMLQTLRKGIVIMALLVWITLLVVTLLPIAFTLVYSCFCRQSNMPPEEDVEEKKPLHGEMNFASSAKVAEAYEV